MKRCVKKDDKKANQSEKPPLFEGAFFIFMLWKQDHCMRYFEGLRV